MVIFTDFGYEVVCNKWPFPNPPEEQCNRRKWGGNSYGSINRPKPKPKPKEKTEIELFLERIGYDRDRR